MRRRSLLAILLVVGCAGGRARETHPFADPERDCRSVATLLAPGRGPTPRMAPSLWRVRACPARAGVLLAEALRDSRAIADTGQLHGRTWLAQYIHDAQLLAAASEVATDTTAAAEARLAALRVLLWSKAPGHLVPMRTMIEGPTCDPARCRSTYTMHFYHGGPVAGDTTSWPVFGAPMPAGYAARIDSIASQLEGAPDTPALVRRAARVVLAFPPDRELEGR